MALFVFMNHWITNTDQSMNVWFSFILPILMFLWRWFHYLYLWLTYPFFFLFLSILFLNFTWMNLPLLKRSVFELMRMKTPKLGLSNWVSLMKFQCLLSLILRTLYKSIPSRYSHLILILSFSHSIFLNLENWHLHRRWMHISIIDISCWFSSVTYPYSILINFIFLHFTLEFQCFVLKRMLRLLYQR